MDSVVVGGLAILALIIGIVAGYIGFKSNYEKKLVAARESAEMIIKDAEKDADRLKKEVLLEAKEENHKYRAEVENELKERRNEVLLQEKRMIQREKNLDRKDEILEKREQSIEVKETKIQEKLERVTEKENQAEALVAKQQEELERISTISKEEAQEIIMKDMTEQLSKERAIMIKESEQLAKDEADKNAKNIILQAIQRSAADLVSENTVTVMTLPSDEMKGRIIGREGRNIRTLESLTGIDVIIDETPEAVVLSGFDPIRREIAKMTLEKLISDGRIHPARIEEVVAKVKKQLDNEIIETGKRTAIDLGIHGLHPELIRIIGKMKYRSSYGQNLLQHARETANLCAVMASELGLNPKKAKRAGLLHDIGKVPDEETDLPHALYGGKIAEKYKEKPDICNAIAAHHDEVEMTTLLAPIVQVCDAISGARPGARREIVEAYIKRLNDLEAIAMSYPGVTKTYAIQAGRELRVIVGADKMDDAESEKLSSEIAEKIQNEMTYPGQVKITVIREIRSVAYAK